MIQKVYIHECNMIHKQIMKMYKEIRSITGLIRRNNIIINLLICWRIEMTPKQDPT